MNPLFSDLERLVLRYAGEMTRKVRVDRALVGQLRRHLSLEALVQLTLSIAAANFTNRFNEALGTELESESLGLAGIGVDRPQPGRIVSGASPGEPGGGIHES